MKKHRRKLGLDRETIRVLSNPSAVVGGVMTGISCSVCSLSNNPQTLQNCGRITCSCNNMCAEL